MRRRSGLSPAPIEFLPRRFYLVVIRERTTCSIRRSKDSSRDSSFNSMATADRHLFPRTPGIQFVSLQDQLLPSTPSCGEFLLGIPQTIRFNSFLTGILRSTATSPLVEDSATLCDAAKVGSEKAHYFFLRRRHLREEIQAVHLICRWRLLYLKLPPHEALAPFEHLPYLFSPYLSSSDPFDPPNLLVSLVGIASGLEKEILGRYTRTNGTTEPTWDLLAHSDEEPKLWTISQRFLVYNGSCTGEAGSDESRKSAGLKQDEQPDDLRDTLSVFKRRKVSLVVNMSKPNCEPSVFSTEGLETLDIAATPSASTSTLSHGDKLAPTDEVLVSRFLEACEGTEGLIAVNASSELGCVSAATCIGCYLMKHSNFTSQEAIGWLRFCLPVKIPLAWELFLGQMQSQMWLEGERFRRAREGDDISESPTSDAMHINIGKISLGRVSLLGTRDRDRHRADPHTANIPVTTCLSSRTQEPHQSPTAATTSAQLKRRPLTQGSAGSRRYHRSTDGTSLRADFALMHKFLHQTPSTSTRSPATTTSSTTTATTPLHAVPSRPKASRSPDGTPANCTEALA